MPPVNPADVKSMASDPPANPPAAAPAASDPPANPPEKPERPDWLGAAFDSYWSDEKGVDHETFTNDWTALQEMRAAQEARTAQIPDNIDEYPAELPEDFQVPDNINFKFDPEHPVTKEVLPEARQMAKDLGLTRDEFKKLVGFKARYDIAEMKMLNAKADEEKAKLGTKGGERRGAVQTWIKTALGNEAYNALWPLTFSAKQVEGWEKIISLAKGEGTKFSGGGRETDQPKSYTKEEYDQLSPQGRIARARELNQGKAA